MDQLDFKNHTKMKKLLSGLILLSFAAPSNVPTAISGRLPMYYDSTNNQFYIYIYIYNTAWKKVALT